MHRFVDYLRYRKGNGRHSAPSDMGYVPEQFFTEEGLALLAAVREFIGRPPKFRGCNKAGVYFKWVVRDGEDDTFAVLKDFLIDKGYTVTLVRSTNKLKPEQSFVKINVV